MPAVTPEPAAISVKRLLEQIKARLEPPFAAVCVVGEVSNFSASTKHWYFTLKEEGAALKCAVWASQQRFLKHAPKNGERVVVKGSLNLYVAGGSISLAVTHCELAGVGDLQQRLRELEAALRAEGIFDRPKRPLPSFPKRLGVVAALGGAALRDVLEVTARRAPGIHILVAPASAQGERSPEENLRALEWVSDPIFGCDAVLLVRGGGSIEDLWGYNDPALVRAVAACPIPIVTGVGHEIDTTLVDLAADRRAATPSQAAELATPDLAQLRAELRRRAEALSDRMQWRLRGLESTLNLLIDSAGLRALPERLARLRGRHETLMARLQGAHPARRLDLSAQRFVHLRQRLLRASGAATGEADAPRLLLAQRRLLPAAEKRLATLAQRLAVLGAKLAGLDPKGPLARGFVLVKGDDGHPLTSAAQAPKDAAVSLQWLDGARRARIES